MLTLYITQRSVIMTRAEVRWHISHYKMTPEGIANRIAVLEARIANPLPAQTNALGYRLRDLDEIRYLREELALENGSLDICKINKIATGSAHATD